MDDSARRREAAGREKEKATPAFVVRVLHWAGYLVPSAWRPAWRAEWEAEVAHRLERSRRWGKLRGRNRMRILKEILGAFPDAVTLRREFIGDFGRNVKFGARGLRRNPGFSIVAVLTLALGLGSSMAIFSVLNSVVLKPLPYPAADRVIAIWAYLPNFIAAENQDSFPLSLFHLKYLFRPARRIQSVSAIKGKSFNFSGSDIPERLEGVQVNSSFFDVMGVQPALGRAFTAQEDRPGSNHVVILGHSLWKRDFAGDPAVIGRFIPLNGLKYEVVGIMPPGFDFPHGGGLTPWVPLPRSTQIWTPIAIPPERLAAGRGPSEYVLLARLKPGVNLEMAQAQLDAISNRMSREIPRSKNYNQMKAVLLQDQLVGRSRTMLVALFGAVGFFMLIICVNISNLILARINSRSKELAVRLALGASRLRLAFQILTENLVLVCTGAALGLPLGVVGVRWITAFGPRNLPRLQEISVDARVVGFTLLVALLSVFLSGLTPAFQAGREDIESTLREGGRGTGAGRRGALFRSGLIVSEVAICVILLAGAGLLARSLFRLMEVDPGFKVEKLLTLEVTLPADSFTTQKSIVHFYDQLRERLRALPSVRSVGVSNVVPLAGNREGTVFVIQGHPVARADIQKYSAGYSMVNREFFQALEIPILKGRVFQEKDYRPDAPAPVVINRSMAREFFPGLNPLDQRIKVGASAQNRFPWMQIVGVVGNIKETRLSEADTPQMYLPLTLETWIPLHTLQVAVRSSLAPQSLLGEIRNQMRELDPALAVAKVRPMQELMNQSLARPRFSALLMALFAIFALLLSAIGLYGLIAFSVTQQVQEIGIRMALGAQRGDVLKLVVKRGLMLTGTGLLLGLLGALLASRFLASLLYQIRPADPFTLITISALLLSIALLACLIPGRRAARIDPATALRTQ